jgi:hypothetical protein
MLTRGAPSPRSVRVARCARFFGRRVATTPASFPPRCPVRQPRAIGLPVHRQLAIGARALAVPCECSPLRVSSARHRCRTRVSARIFVSTSTMDWCSSRVIPSPSDVAGETDALCRPTERRGVLDRGLSSWIRFRLQSTAFRSFSATKFVWGARMWHHSSIADSRAWATVLQRP